jgi:hypothetical protein
MRDCFVFAAFTWMQELTRRTHPSNCSVAGFHARSSAMHPCTWPGYHLPLIAVSRTQQVPAPHAGKIQAVYDGQMRRLVPPTAPAAAMTPDQHPAHPAVHRRARQLNVDHPRQSQAH